MTEENGKYYNPDGDMEMLGGVFLFAVILFVTGVIAAVVTALRWYYN